MSWWNNSWANRTKFTINNSGGGLTGDLADFPVLVVLNNDRVDYSKINVSGGDLRFVANNDNDLLSHEIDTWNYSGTSYVWVKVPQIVASTDTGFFYAYYNGTDLDVQNKTDVWSDNFSGVYHFAETGGNYLDSSPKANNSTAISVSGRTTTGVLGYAPSFSAASSHRITLGKAFTTGHITQSAWVRLATAGTRPITQHAAAGETQGTNIVYGLETDASRRLWQQWEHGAGVNDTNTSTAVVPLNIFTHVACVRDSVAKTVRWYINGIPSGSNSTYTNQPDGGTDAGDILYIGGRITSAQYWHGQIDELRLHFINRNDPYILADYKTQTDDFLNYGSEDSVPVILAVSSRNRFWIID